jgi:hypothetical protein
VGVLTFLKAIATATVDNSTPWASAAVHAARMQTVMAFVTM